MDRSFLVQFIQATSSTPTPDAEQIAEHFRPLEIGKNEYVLQQGQICNEYIFVETGFLRAFTFDEEGKEVSTNFYGKNSAVFEVSSYFRREPTKENIQALTPCFGWVGNYEEFQVLFHTIPAFRIFGRTILVNGFVALKERMLSMINNSAEERYLQLLQSESEILQNVPLKHIASYLGVTDTSLSRIRKEIAKR